MFVKLFVDLFWRLTKKYYLCIRFRETTKRSQNEYLVSPQSEKKEFFDKIS